MFDKASENLVWEIRDLLREVGTEDGKLLDEALGWLLDAKGKTAEDFLAELDVSADRSETGFIEVDQLSHVVDPVGDMFTTISGKDLGGVSLKLSPYWQYKWWVVLTELWLDRPAPEKA
jgi:hypothetical protein